MDLPTLFGAGEVSDDDDDDENETMPIMTTTKPAMTERKPAYELRPSILRSMK